MNYSIIYNRELIAEIKVGEWGPFFNPFTSPLLKSYILLFCSSLYGIQEGLIKQIFFVFFYQGGPVWLWGGHNNKELYVCLCLEINGEISQMSSAVTSFPYITLWRFLTSSPPHYEGNEGEWFWSIPQNVFVERLSVGEEYSFFFPDGELT